MNLAFQRPAQASREKLARERTVHERILAAMGQSRAVERFGIQTARGDAREATQLRSAINDTYRQFLEAGGEEKPGDFGDIKSGDREELLDLLNAVTTEATSRTLASRAEAIRVGLEDIHRQRRELEHGLDQQVRAALEDFITYDAIAKGNIDEKCVLPRDLKAMLLVDNFRSTRHALCNHHVLRVAGALIAAHSLYFQSFIWVYFRYWLGST